MKALGRALARQAPVVVAAEGTFTDPEDSQIQSARAALRHAVEAAPAGSVVPLSLDGVALTASCVAQVLVPALSDIVAGRFPGRFIIVEDPIGRNRWDGDASLKKESERLGQKLVCAWQWRQLELVGPVDTQVRSTYNLVLDRWRSREDGTTARDLAEHFSISIQAASNRLAKAAGLGLLYDADRESVSGGGTQYVFVPVA